MLALVSGLILGLASTAVAQQQENRTQNQAQSFQLTGECVMMPANQTTTESPFMTCQYTRSEADSQMDSQSLFDRMMERMQQMMGGNQSMQGQGMGGQ
jgi:uncharacterized protein HemX